MDVKGGGGMHLAVNLFKFGTKISLRKLWAAYVLCENMRQKEIPILCI